LRPSILDDLGLVAALRWYLDRVAKRSSFEQHYSAEGVQSRLPSNVETACFRVAQEALTNIVRHAGSHSVHVKLDLTDGTLRLTISDDGKGFNVQESREKAIRGGSLGILGMQERVTLLGGTLDFISTPGKGTDVIAYFPLK
jgi:signal transduction histidine kinase